ncbi:MAG TPA: hypothetical protein VGT79_08335 [Xanthomonadaceae bacterium]|nr:hypothetical protein [Xanthomonadaceae bacterium]
MHMETKRSTRVRALWMYSGWIALVAIAIGACLTWWPNREIDDLRLLSVKRVAVVRESDWPHAPDASTSKYELKHPIELLKVSVTSKLDLFRFASPREFNVGNDVDACQLQSGEVVWVGGGYVYWKGIVVSPYADEDKEFASIDHPDDRGSECL